MTRDLEQLLLKRGKVWADSELVFFAYDAVRELPVEAAVSQLRTSLSGPAFGSLQQASHAVIQRLSADTDSFGVGWITPEAPAQCHSIPMEFIHRLNPAAASSEI